MDNFPLDMTWFRAVAGLLVGLILGSFTTMLSYRLPRRLSIVAPPSRCPRCQTRLRPLDLIPVLSWLLSGGKCRHCAAPIGKRYVLIELATATAITLAFVLLGLSWALAAAIAAIIATVTAITIRLERDGRSQ